MRKDKVNEMFKDLYNTDSGNYMPINIKKFIAFKFRSKKTEI